MAISIDLAGRTALVTGGGRGIGKAIAALFADAGAKVAIASRKREVLEATAKELSGRSGSVAAFPCHIGRVEEVEQLIPAIEAALGPIDILVNNAATNIQLGPVLEATDEALVKMVETNIQGALRLVRRVAPGMCARKRGSIINIASVSGLRPQQNSAFYSLTKAALLMLTRSLAQELGPSGVRVNAIAPGLVKTDFSAALWQNEAVRERYLAGQMLPGLAEPEEIAPAALFLAGDGSRFVTGHVLVVDGGLSAR